MAFVSVPKDLTKVKNKIILNLTKRQLICFGIAAAVGPLEKVLKNVITVKFIRPPVRKYEVENLYEKKKIMTKAKGGTVRGKIKKR